MKVETKEIVHIEMTGEEVSELLDILQYQSFRSDFASMLFNTINDTAKLKGD